MTGCLLAKHVLLRNVLYRNRRLYLKRDYGIVAHVTKNNNHFVLSFLDFILILTDAFNIFYKIFLYIYNKYIYIYIQSFIILISVIGVLCK